jgi:transcriptional regulator with XRE-family HTH domain
LEIAIEPVQLRKLLSANIKARREILGISQEKLAENANISVQMVNTIEGCRTWVGDKTLTQLAKALRVEVFQLFAPLSYNIKEGDDKQISGLLINLRQNIKDEIDAIFDKLLNNTYN